MEGTVTIRIADYEELKAKAEESLEKKIHQFVWDLYKKKTEGKTIDSNEVAFESDTLMIKIKRNPQSFTIISKS